MSTVFTVTFGASTMLTPVAPVTLGGVPYATADLYSLAFGSNGAAYTNSGPNGTLFSINLATGALTSFGSQGGSINQDFASCPFAPQPALSKAGPTMVSVGGIVSYQIIASNAAAATASAYGIALQDPVPAGIAILSATCTGTSGVVCAAPTIAAQNVSTTVTAIPPGGSATLKISGRDTSLAVGTATNTASLTAKNSAALNASSTVTVVANTVNKTVANITQATGPTGTSDVAEPGNTLEYVLSYTDNTNAALTGFSLQDTIPANTTYVTASAACVTTPAGLTCLVAGPTSSVLSWTYSGGSLPPGQAVSVKFRVTVN